MPSRLLREGIIDSDAVNALSWEAEVFYRRLMSVVDDFGRFDGRPSILRGRLYALKSDKVREADIPRWLAECELAGLIVLYEAGTKPYILFRKLGPPRAKDSKFPPPPAELGGPPAANDGEWTEIAVPVCVGMKTDVNGRTQAFSSAPYSDSDSGSDSIVCVGPDPGGARGPDQTPDPPPSLAVFVAAWNAAGGLMPIAESSRLRGLWQARWDQSPEFRRRWREAVERMARSDRCRGIVGEWKATPEWFLRDDTLARLLVRGEFDNPAPRQPHRGPAKESTEERIARKARELREKEAASGR